MIVQCEACCGRDKNTAGARGVATTDYEKSVLRYGDDGGKCLLTPQQRKEVVESVEMWRNSCSQAA